MNVTLIGLFGGLFFSLLGYAAYYFHFTEVGPGLTISMWMSEEFEPTALGEWISVFLNGILGIGAAFLYRVLFIRFKGPTAGVFYGVILWVIIFQFISPLFPAIKGILSMSFHSIVTTLCLYIVFGLFVGYSVSFDYHERLKSEELSKKEELW
ncbi:hypothetical protein FLK61_29950 [Paenalkalicoccus suaedae]|uniref:Uncharacterized protein n=2 Tax=Paenalkalicoccus suaedae TaxID=2592382 RepID=A0A859FDN3_9BACI|nr:hypothetical protein FLK61_29950 [Paenalkalicoccus suaedae]